MVSGNLPGGPAGAGPNDNPYAPDEDDAERLRRFTMEPVAPVDIEARLAEGATLATVDVPAYLDRPLVVGVDTAPVLYRLVQLFGTPNVPGLRAGDDQPERYRRTWQYLFRATYEPEDGVERTFLVSAYDYETDLSVGISAWVEDGEGRLPEPTPDPPDAVEVPDEEMLVSSVQLVAQSVESAVQATYEDLWV